MTDDDLLQLREDDEVAALLPEREETAWRVLIVDDDVQVHQVTRFALQGTRILGRALAFDSAYSAAEARTLLARGRYSCILLDVVMESEDAGLKLVGEIRERFDDPAVRIVLRTGQPGYAPELEVIQHYDINDYRAKSELTSQRLVTSLTTALRSYEQICTIEANRAGLQRVFDASSGLLSVQAVRSFCERVLSQICGLLDVPIAGTICGGPNGREVVLAAVGATSAVHGQALAALSDTAQRLRIEGVIARGSSDFAAGQVSLYLRSNRLGALAVDIPTGGKRLSDLDRRLLDLYSINVMVGLDNAQLFEELEQFAFHDPLTGLWNRTALERELGRRCALGLDFVLVLADIDNFQAVNDGLGHEVGDRCLRAAAAILADVFAGELFLARTAADNFALVLADKSQLPQQLQALTRHLARNIEVDDHLVPLTLTVGIASYPEHGHSASLLFRNAGIALKSAKQSQRGSARYFDGRYEQQLRDRLDTIRALRQVLERDELRLVYQPQLSLRTGESIGSEALLRWQRPGHGLCAPDRFIPAAEDSGLIVPIGAYVLREACKQLREWSQQHSAGSMAVNVSPRQLKDPNFVSLVRAAIADSGIAPAQLELEVTESLLLEDWTHASDCLQQIRALGVRIAIDDFGTGHSSLSRLQQLPLDRLKIDRSFVAALGASTEQRVIVELIINLGHALGLAVLAEGVETAEQAKILRELGCDEAQGFYFAKPMLAADYRRHCWES